MGSRRWWLVGIVAAAGCGPSVVLDADSGSTGETADGATTEPDGRPDTSGMVPPDPSTTTSGGPTGTSVHGEEGDPETDGPDGTTDTGEVDDDGSPFITPPDACWVPPPGTKAHCGPFLCDLFEQDCPRGEKCMPWANDGGPAWNSTRCSPIDADPGQDGDPCLPEGSFTSGVDDCGFGLMCFPFEIDAEEGVCTPLCTGSAAAPACPGDRVCIVANDGNLPLCLDRCNPVAQDCEHGDCFYGPEFFTCGPVAAGASPGAACVSGECAPGSSCLTATGVPGCTDTSCCSSLCDLTAPDPASPCLPGQTCEPLFSPGTRPEGYAYLGICNVL